MTSAAGAGGGAGGYLVIQGLIGVTVAPGAGIFAKRRRRRWRMRDQ
jgi:hypothetical protein